MASRMEGRQRGENVERTLQRRCDGGQRPDAEECMGILEKNRERESELKALIERTRGRIYT